VCLFAKRIYSNVYTICSLSLTNVVPNINTDLFLFTNLKERAFKVELTEKTVYMLL